jgi:hypothetical protein
MEDATEGEGVYAQLCGYVESNNPAVLGKNFANMPKLVSVFSVSASLCCAVFVCDSDDSDSRSLCCVVQEILGTDFVDAELSARIINILNQMKKLPAQVMTQLLNSFPAEKKAKITEMFAKLPPPTTPAASGASAAASPTKTPN